MVGYDSRSKQRWLDYHNQHESAAFIGLFHRASLVLPPVLWRVTGIIGNRHRQEYRGTSPLCSGESHFVDIFTTVNTGILININTVRKDMQIICKLGNYMQLLCHTALEINKFMY